MSAMTNNITYFVLNQISIPQTPNVSIEVNTTKVSNDYYMLGNRYKIQTTWSVSIDIEPCHLDAAMENFKRELKEAIYGDIKNMIYRLDKAVIENNREKALMGMRDIIREIFE